MLNVNTLKENPQQLIDFLSDVNDENKLIRKLKAEGVHLNLATALIALNNYIRTNGGEENMDEFSTDNPDGIQAQETREREKELEDNQKEVEEATSNNSNTEVSGTAEQQEEQKLSLSQTGASRDNIPNDQPKSSSGIVTEQEVDSKSKDKQGKAFSFGESEDRGNSGSDSAI